MLGIHFFPDNIRMYFFHNKIGSLKISPMPKTMQDLFISSDFIPYLYFLHFHLKEQILEEVEKGKTINKYVYLNWCSCTCSFSFPRMQVEREHFNSSIKNRNFGMPAPALYLDHRTSKSVVLRTLTVEIYEAIGNI